MKEPENRPAPASGSPGENTPSGVGRRLHRPPSLKHGPVGVCDYCGAALVGHVFFCLVCGRPYREAPGSRAMPAPKSRGEIVRERAPGFWPVVWTYGIALFAGFLITVLLFGWEEQIHACALIVSSLIMLAATLGLTVRYPAYLTGTLRQAGFGRWEAWAGLAGLAPLLAVNVFWHGSFLDALTHEDLKVDFSEVGLSKAGVLLLLCVLPSITEELGFRGLLQPMLSGALGRKKAVWMVAALFAAMHLSAYSFPYLVLVGLLLGWVRDRSRSLYPGMLIHGLHNGFVVAFFWS